MIAFLATITLLAGVVGALAARLVLWTQAVVRRDARRLAEGEAIFLVAYCIGDGVTPSPRYRDRLKLGRELWERTRLPIWCLGGLLARRERTNGHDSKRYLQRLGVPPEAVRIIDEFPFLGESVETIQEVEAANELARQLQVRRLIVVSDILQLAQVRLVLSKDIDAILVASPLIPLGRRFDFHDLYYFGVRCATLFITLMDRRGRALGWLRAWRRGRFGPSGPVRTGGRNLMSSVSD